VSELAFYRILIRDKTISEIDGQPIVTIQRSEIVRIRLLHGRLAAQPWFFLVGGASMLLLGIVGLYLVTHALTTSGFDGMPKTGAVFLLGLITGPLFGKAGLDHGAYLEVQTTHGTRRLLFGKELEVERLGSFVERAREMGVEIEVPVVEQRQRFAT
jgi:hypothetical protein